MYNLGMKDLDITESNSIGELCRLIREREGMSTTEWSRILEEKQSSISRIENEGVSLPKAYLKKLLPYLRSKEEEGHMVQLMVRVLIKELHE